LKNRFWQFVQNFWSCSGSYDYCDEWHSDLSHFYSTINPKDSIFKNILFSYKLDLYRQNRGYNLFVELQFSYRQRIYIASRIKVKSKKEGIRQSLKAIKEFQNNSKLLKEIWLKQRSQIPILNSKFEWVSTLLIGDVGNFLYKSNVFTQDARVTLGYGDFYSLEFFNEKWYWVKHSIHGFGYSSCRFKEIIIEMWLVLLDFDFPLKSVIDEVKKYILNSKSVFISEGITGKLKAEKFLKVFYESQSFNHLDLLKN
jgi:hypothetical protein